MPSLDPSRLRRQLTGGIDVLERYIATPFASPNEEAIIVLGNSKSGTTVIAALLAEYAGLSVTLDFWPRMRDPATLAAVHSGAMSFDAFVHRFRADFARDIVKDPHLTFLYPELSRRFPRARFVMVMRDPRDNIRSILNRLGLRGDLEDLEESAYREMRPLWEAILKNRDADAGGETYIERLASRWSVGARVYLDHADEMELIRYEDFLADKAGAVAGLAGRLGLEKRGRIEDKLERRYQPPGDRAADWTEFFGPGNLAAIERITRDEALALGY